MKGTLNSRGGQIINPMEMCVGFLKIFTELRKNTNGGPQLQNIGFGM